MLSFGNMVKGLVTHGCLCKNDFFYRIKKERDSWAGEERGIRTILGILGLLPVVFKIFHYKTKNLIVR